jgi:multiple sugar transport system substrate-binding protein
MKSRLIFLISVLAIVSMLFTACAQATPAPQATQKPAQATQAPAQATQAPAQATQAPATGEPVKISLYSVAWTTIHQVMMAKLAAKFNEEYKGKIQVEIVQGDWGSVDTYMTGGIAGGGGIADIVENGTDDGKSWYQQGYLTDLRPYITDEIRATMPADLWAARTAPDGTVFLSGTSTEGQLLVYYNPEALKKAGIAPATPDKLWTWDDLIANAKLLTLDKNGKHLGEAGFDAANVVQYGFVPRLDNEKTWEEGGVFYMQATGGIPLVHKGGDGKWDIFFEDAGMPVLKAYTSLVQIGVTPKMAIGLGGTAQDEAFKTGMAAMVLRAYFNIAVLQSNYPDFKFGVMPIPLAAGNKVYYTDNIGQGYAIPKTSKHPAEAATFMFWMQQPEQQAMHSSALDLPPVNPLALQDPVLLNDPNWDTMRFYVSIQKLVPVDYSTNVPEFETTLYGPTMMQIVSGDKTFDQAIQEIKAGAKAILNQ